MSTDLGDYSDDVADGDFGGGAAIKGDFRRRIERSATPRFSLTCSGKPEDTPGSDPTKRFDPARGLASDPTLGDGVVSLNS